MKNIQWETESSLDIILRKWNQVLQSEIKSYFVGTKRQSIDTHSINIYLAKSCGIWIECTEDICVTPCLKSFYDIFRHMTIIKIIIYFVAHLPPTTMKYSGQFLRYDTVEQLHYWEHMVFHFLITRRPAHNGGPFAYYIMKWNFL